jgi:hypothetical protein
MPQNIAYPLGGPKADFKYFYIQMHYSNPAIIPSNSYHLVILNHLINNYFLFYNYDNIKDLIDNSGWFFFSSIKVA